MGSLIAKALVPLLLSLLCFTVSSEKAEPLPAEPPLHQGSYHHYPTSAPVSAPPSHHHHGHPPSHAPSQAPKPHHRHHHGHAPAPAPVHTPVHAPMHPPKPHSPPPVHPPKPPSPPPVHPPKPPSPPPVHPPKPPSPPPVHPPKPPSPPPVPAHPPKNPHPQPPSHHFPRKLIAVQGVVYCKSCNHSGEDTLLGAKPVLGATVKLQCNNTKYPIELKTTTDKNGYFLVKAPGTITNYGYHKCKAWLVSAPNTACSKVTDLHGGLTGAILRPEKKPYFDEKKREYALFSVGPFAFEPKCPR